ncbi:MAG TPA: hypothetical protein VHP55_04185 [Usitatibacter sp.]|jgi:hypothetical protein|nr:hypothetical protein [Usitatibacter sp.]
MKKRLAPLLAAAVLAPAAALACGACVEDKVAATYDHAVVTKAARQGKVVVFAEPRTAADPARVERALRAAAARAPGVEPASVRASQSPAALSFVLDPRGHDPGKTLASIRSASRVADLQLVLLKVLR